MLHANQHIRIVLFFGLCLGLMAPIMVEGAGTRTGISSQQFTRITEGPLVSDAEATPGVCMVDYDGDGLLDFYLVNSSQEVTGVANSLYRNIGNASFERVTGIPIVEDLASGYAASWGDYDNDGDLDLAVANWGLRPSTLYVNNGEGSFAATANGPLSMGEVGSTSASWIDYDLDNDLDLFIANSYGNEPPDYPPYRNFLFRNDNGTLNLITSGIIATHERRTYGATWGDYDNDGDPDLVNTNNGEGEPADLFLNNGDGSFTLLPTSVLGPEYSPGACTWVDYDNDGDLDLHIVKYWEGFSLLYRNDGSGVLSSVPDNGLGIVGGRGTGGIWADYDNDGDQDVLIWFEAVDAGALIRCHGYLFDNLGDGTFSRLSDAVFEFEKYCVLSAVSGDVDRDGDVDFLLGRFDPEWQARPEYGSEILYLNNGNSNHWVTVKPVGTSSNRSAVGVKVRCKATINGQPVWQMDEIRTMTGRRTQPPLELHFGLGDATIIDSLRLEWPSGIVDVLTDVAVDQFLSVTESVCGDANGDGDANVGDAVYIINYVFKGGSAPDPVVAGDANCDGDCNVGDAVYLINYVFKGGPGPCAGC